MSSFQLACGSNSHSREREGYMATALSNNENLNAMNINARQQKANPVAKNQNAVPQRQSFLHQHSIQIKSQAQGQQQIKSFRI